MSSQVLFVFPAKAGIQRFSVVWLESKNWIPASAGKTDESIMDIEKPRMGSPSFIVGDTHMRTARFLTSCSELRSKWQKFKSWPALHNAAKSPKWKYPAIMVGYFIFKQSGELLACPTHSASGRVADRSGEIRGQSSRQWPGRAKPDIRATCSIHDDIAGFRGFDPVL